MERTCKVVEKVIRSHKVLITVEDIKEAFDIPAHVEVLIPTYGSDDRFGESPRYVSLYGNIKSEWVEEDIVRASP